MYCIKEVIDSNCTLVFNTSSMKLAIVLLSLAAFVAAEEPRLDTAFGYLKKFGVPLAEKIRAREEEYFNNPLSRIFGGSPASLGQFPYQVGRQLYLYIEKFVNVNFITFVVCFFIYIGEGCYHWTT